MSGRVGGPDRGKAGILKASPPSKASPLGQGLWDLESQRNLKSVGAERCRRGVKFRKRVLAAAGRTYFQGQEVEMGVRIDGHKGGDGEPQKLAFAFQT